VSKLVTTKDFIQRARKVHGDRYDYSKVEYVAAIKDVTIICPEHGEFRQRPTNHYIGHGCHECGGNKPLTLDKFIKRATRIHKNLYDYSRVEFENVESKIEIICPEHGSFFQRVMSHLKGFGCDRCGRVDVAKKLSHSVERFFEDAVQAHGDRYDYSQVKYINAQTKVTIICPDHGPFEQRPANHIRDIGCPKCGDESTAVLRTLTTEEFVRIAKASHGDRYDYSKAVYKSAHEKVEIVCAEHGSFWQIPPNHYKAGCPGCANSGFDQTKSGLLYYIAVTTDNGDTLYKIGITNLSIKKRFPVPDLARMRVVKTWQFELGHMAAEREAEILSQFSGHRYCGPDMLVGAGNTELFVRDVLGLDKGGQSAVDADANLISRPIQLSFDFSDVG
jgi:Zn finger protein HypA/HybF involved in hydrogenase expression